MRRRMGTQLGVIQRLPLAAGPQDVEDRIGTTPIRHTRSPAPKAMRIDVDGQQRLQDRPQRIGNTETGRSVIIGDTWSTAFLRFCFVHTLQYSRLFG
jgi:hypothetical protein